MVPSHTGGAQDHPLLNRIKDFGGLDSETCSSPRAYAYVEKRGRTARVYVCVRARRTRKGDGGRDAYRDEISKRNRGKEEARSRAHVSFLSFSFPPFPFFTRRSEHGGSAFREEEGACEGDWKHGGEGVVAGGSYRVGHARSGDGPSDDDPTTASSLYPLLAFPTGLAACRLPTSRLRSRDATPRVLPRPCRVTISPAPSIRLAPVHQFPTFARSTPRLESLVTDPIDPTPREIFRPPTSSLDTELFHDPLDDMTSRRNNTTLDISTPRSQHNTRNGGGSRAPPRQLST